MKKINPLFILLGLGALWYFTKKDNSETSGQKDDLPGGGGGPGGGPGGGASDFRGPIPPESLPEYSGERGSINPLDVLQF